MVQMKPDIEKEILTIERQSNGWNAKMMINPRGVKQAKDGARFDFTLFGF